MTCPYCGETMRRGFILCDGRRRPSWQSENEDKRVALTKFDVISLLSSYRLEAFYCDACQKVILDTANSK